MKLKVVNGGAELAVSETTFGQEYNEALVHQVVIAYRQAGRAGTKAQKTRAEVRGGGKKPHAQKGTGQARAGSSRSPIWVGGGVTFAARRAISRRRSTARCTAARSARCSRSWCARIAWWSPSEIALEAPKTKLLATQLTTWRLSNVLIIVEAIEEKLFLAARNLPHVEVLPVAQSIR